MPGDPEEALAADPAEQPATVSANTRRAYAADWARFGRWCRTRGASPLPPDPALLGRYLAETASAGGPRLSLASLERAVSGLAWNYRVRGLALDRTHPDIAAALAAIRETVAAPPRRKAPLSTAEILAMAATLPHDLRGLRDRAMLLLGFAGGLRRSELVGLDLGGDDGARAGAWVVLHPEGALVTLRGKAGPRRIAVGRGSSDRTCPVRALESWLEFARVDTGVVFRRVSRDGARALPSRLSDRHVARLVKATVNAAGLRPELGEAERDALFSGQSLRAGMAGTGQHLVLAGRETGPADDGHGGLFRINLTRAAGL